MADGLHYHDDSEGDSMEEESTELKQAAEEAFPDEDWTPSRLGSLKTLMKMCMGEYGPDGADDEGAEDDDKHKATLALLFGGKPKK